MCWLFRYSFIFFLKIKIFSLSYFFLFLKFFLADQLANASRHKTTFLLLFCSDGPTRQPVVGRDGFGTFNLLPKFNLAYVVLGGLMAGHDGLTQFTSTN